MEPAFRVNIGMLPQALASGSSSLLAAMAEVGWFTTFTVHHFSLRKRLKILGASTNQQKGPKGGKKGGFLA